MRLEWNNTTRTVSTISADGVVVSTRPYTTDENAAAEAASEALVATANEADLRNKARGALTANATFLADGSVTQAEAVAQVQKLTRQVNALIKLEVRDLADQTGT